MRAWTDPVAPCGGECSGNYCHGSTVMSCGWGLVFNPTGLYCNTPSLEGCEHAIAYAAAREGGASSPTSSTQSSTLVAALSVAVAVLAGCVVALVVVHLRGRRAAPAADAQLSEVAVDGVSMRREFAHQTLPDDKEQQKKEACDV